MRAISLLFWATTRSGDAGLTTSVRWRAASTSSVKAVPIERIAMSLQASVMVLAWAWAWVHGTLVFPSGFAFWFFRRSRRERRGLVPRLERGGLSFFDGFGQAPGDPGLGQLRIELDYLARLKGKLLELVVRVSKAPD